MSHSVVEIYSTARRQVGDDGEAAVYDEWRWRLKAANGEIVASGEGYGSRSDAERGYFAAAKAMAEAKPE